MENSPKSKTTEMRLSELREKELAWKFNASKEIGHKIVRDMKIEMSDINMDRDYLDKLFNDLGK